MKNLKKTLCMTLAIALSAGCLTGCGGNKKAAQSGGEKEIEIRVWNSGYGTGYVENMKEAFMKKYPEYNVKITDSVEAVNPSWGLADVDTTDLYVGVANTDVEYLEPLDDVLETTVEGEAVAIKEKFTESYLSGAKYPDGHYYNMSPGNEGATSFVYNKKIFDQAGITQLPRTSDELAVVCDTLMEQKITPLCHFQTGGYWGYIAEAWFLQYEGWENYRDKFYACVDDEGNSPSATVFTKKDGRYKAFQAFEKIITPQYILMGSNSADHITMQTRFLNGEAAMMVNGQWLENEMSSVGKVDDFSMMKMPVLSSITDKLDTVKTETLLRQVITAIDEVADGTKAEEDYKKGENYVVNGQEVSASDWEYVKLARHTAGNEGTMEMYIPNYSDAKEGAKEFIKFWFSEEGANILADSLNVTPIYMTDASKIDTSDWSAYQKNVDAVSQGILQTASQTMKSKHKIFTYGGAYSYGYKTGIIVGYFCAANPADQLDANGAWDLVLKAVEENYENTWLANIK